MRYIITGYSMVMVAGIISAVARHLGTPFDWRGWATMELLIAGVMAICYGFYTKGSL